MPAWFAASASRIVSTEIPFEFVAISGVFAYGAVQSIEYKLLLTANNKAFTDLLYKRDKRKREAPLFIVSVLDEGEERNFVAVALHISDGQVHIDVGGVEHHFELVDLIDILSVEHRRTHDLKGRVRARAACH